VERIRCGDVAQTTSLLPWDRSPDSWGSNGIPFPHPCALIFVGAAPDWAQSRQQGAVVTSVDTLSFAEATRISRCTRSQRARAPTAPPMRLSAGCQARAKPDGTSRPNRFRLVRRQLRGHWEFPVHVKGPGNGLKILIRRTNWCIGMAPSCRRPSRSVLERRDGRSEVTLRDSFFA